MNDYPPSEATPELPASEQEMVPLTALPASDAVLNDSAGASAAVVCWRCAKHVTPAEGLCPYCRAVLTAGSGQTKVPVQRRPAEARILRLIWVFVLLLGTSLVYGWINHFGFERHEPGPKSVARSRNQILIVEAIDMVLVGAALLWIGRPAPLARRSVRRRVLIWLVAAPLLAVMLGVNIGYHWLLRQALPSLPIDNYEWLGREMGWIILAICIQPAVVEEVFFRYLALGSLRSVMGDHAAVAISAIMFGMAHIGAPLSIPVLMVVGLFLGYVRVAGRTLVLPVLLHFAHNLVVVLLSLLS